jgi:hypothetical protein
MFACLSTLLFALDFKSLEKSAGIGFTVSPYWHTEEARSDAELSRRTFQTLLYGVSAYFDATYVQASVGFGWSSSLVALKVDDDLGIMGGVEDVVYGDYPVETYLALALLGKYPFDMGGFYVFPIAGCEYDLSLRDTGMSGDDLDFDKVLWLKAGIGLDIPIVGKVYIRPEALACYRLRTSREAQMISDYKSSGAKDASVTNVKADISLLVGYEL